MKKQPWPLYGWIGIALVGVFWGLNWGLEGLRSHWCFFPLWLGYSLTVDAWTRHRKGTSPIARSPAAYAGLFFASAPAWWLFEAINWRTANWEYLGIHYFDSLGNFLLTTLNFSTVMPAVFGTAELAGTLPWIRKQARGPTLAPTPKTRRAFLAAGLAMFTLTMAWPRLFFPLVWLSVYFVLEPVNAWLGRRTLLDDTAHGDWRPVLALAAGVLICGFFWEMWNYWAYPKWVYHIPFVDFLRVFEMPLLGWLGYLPFSLELFALFHLLAGPAGGRTGPDLIPHP